MKRWSKVIGIALAFTLIVSALAGCGKQSAEEGGTIAKIKKHGKVIAGVKYDLNLFGLKDPSSGQVQGFDIDIAKQIAKKVLGDENAIEFMEVTSKTRIPMLKNGDIDMIVATMTITDERKKEIDFSDVYFKAGQSLLVPVDSKVNSIKDLTKDSKVLTAKGSTSAKNVREAAPDAQVLEFENYAEAFTALKAGQGNALTTDNALLYGMAQQDNNFRVLDETFTEEPYGIGIRKDDKEFTQLVNDTLKELKDSGEYARIYEKWIGKKLD
ncbi:transporter substrate-binding domain-containing protein [Paenibacillus sp.]|jgi:putative glutamine transport system substrate-binding protein|uniref:transporter substrate-binding domain-containing protein n=1 Tax=Paenibacillus sp. TaxID=58172 RepID=UPI002819844F|nr:transporter substrate-binding domain-containing protein [Paenibacillus sp.]MDR0271504.1 transporter substrate-binding domain-containing protein [Paenibacillus sp.]